MSARPRTIACDGSVVSAELLPGAAELLAAALPACILKNVERFAGMLLFRYQHGGTCVLTGC